MEQINTSRKWYPPIEYPRLAVPAILKVNENLSEVNLVQQPLYRGTNPTDTPRDMEVKIVKETDWNTAIHAWGGVEIYTLFIDSNQGAPIDVLVVRQQVDGVLDMWHSYIPCDTWVMLFGTRNWGKAAGYVVSHLLNLAFGYSFYDDKQPQFRSINFDL